MTNFQRLGAGNTNMGPWTLGPWTVKPDENRLLGPDGDVSLEAKSMALLMLLMNRQGQVVSNDELITEIWDGRALGDNPVYKVVAKLRKALGDTAETPAFIETIPKKGYRLICPAIAAEPTAPSALDQRTPALVASKKISAPVLFVMVAGVVVLSLAAVLAFRGGAAFTTNEPATIAVLPFTSFSNNPDDALYADGVSEEILNLLAQSKDLKVVSRTSSFQFRESEDDVPTIGRKLGAKYLIEGSVRREGETLRTTAQLIATDTGYHMWSKNFDSNSVRAFAVQFEIADAVAKALNASLNGAETGKSPTTNLEAWRLFLHGRELFRRKGEGPIRSAIENFEQAIERDPEFAEAWAALSEAWVVLPQYSQGDVLANNENGRNAANHAITLNPALAQPYLSLASHAGEQGQFTQAMNYIEQAYELEPQATGVLNSISYAYARAGWMAEALKIAEQGIELDPLEGGQHTSMGYIQMSLGLYDEAEETFFHAWNDLGLKSYFLWEGIFELRLLNSEFDAAADWLAVRPYQNGVEFRRAVLSGMRGGAPDDRENAVGEIKVGATSGALPPHVAFEYLLFLDETDLAFELAMGAAQRGDYFMIHHLHKPSARALQRQPRILDLAEAFGIADLWRTTHRMPVFCAEVVADYDCEAELQKRVVAISQ